MTRRIIVATLAVVLAAAAGTIGFSSRAEMEDDRPSSETLQLVVDISDRTLSVIEEGVVTETHPVTVGSSEHPTPTGSYRIDWLVWNPSWNPPDNDWARDKKPQGPGWNNPMGRVKMFFRSPAYYVHGTRTVEELGQAASHGCVRMSNYDVLKVAQVVMAHGGEARPPNWFKRVINRVTDTREVTLSTPVPVVIQQ